jgi:hypothetical protein
LGTVDSVSKSSFTLTTSAGQKVTVDPVAARRTLIRPRRDSSTESADGPRETQRDCSAVFQFAPLLSQLTKPLPRRGSCLGRTPGRERESKLSRDMGFRGSLCGRLVRHRERPYLIELHTNWGEQRNRFLGSNQIGKIEAEMISEGPPVLCEGALLIDEAYFHPLRHKTPEAIWDREHLLGDKVTEIMWELISIRRERPIA